MPKGRDKDLISKRNESLCRRYYFWTEVQRLRFDDALKILSEQEFFLKEETVVNIIRKASKIDPSMTVPKVKKPRLTFKQLSLFTDEGDYPILQIHHDKRT
jgi:hypothetical protein